MDLDDIFMNSYLNDFEEQQKKKILQSQEEREIAEEKRNKLNIIKQFLQKFVDLDVVVKHCHHYTKNTATLSDIEPQKFEYYEYDSSNLWAPGISILFNHPAEVEIAIPNHVEEGVVVIRASTHHPDAYVLEQNFSTFEAACSALGEFLRRCTVSMKDPREYLQEMQHKVKPVVKQNNTSFIHNVPDYPPEEAPTRVIKEDNKDSSGNGLSLKKISDLFSRKNKDEDE